MGAVLESNCKAKSSQGTVDFHFDVWQCHCLAQIEKALEQSTQINAPELLCEAMRYAVLGGGKRLRPLLVLASSRAVGSPDDHMVLRAACAVELIHAYSLVHDDMPCMDNDILRRGLPTVHAKYGEAIAMLVGDALQSLAFEVLAPLGGLPCLPQVQTRLVALLAHAAGACGMAGGQAIDLSHVGASLTEEQLQHMHLLKTGRLLSCCVAMGMMCAGRELSQQEIFAMELYGRNVGLAFQIVDDILDATQESAVIGKTAGKDAQAGKPTYVSILGLDAARQRVRALYDEACEVLKNSGLHDIEAMQALAAKIVSRSF